MSGGKSTFTLNYSGIHEIMNASPMQAACYARAQKIQNYANSVGSGSYSCDVQAGKTRCHAMVKTADAKARADNAGHNTLLKALNSGRG